MVQGCCNITGPSYDITMTHNVKWTSFDLQTSFVREHASYAAVRRTSSLVISEVIPPLHTSVGNLAIPLASLVCTQRYKVVPNQLYFSKT